MNVQKDIKNEANNLMQARKSIIKLNKKESLVRLAAIT